MASNCFDRIAIICLLGNSGFDKLPNANVAIGMWVIVTWEGEKFLGIVKSKTRKLYHVVCLEKPFGAAWFGVSEPQLLEAKGDNYEEVYRASITTPCEVDIDGTVYWQYELLNWVICCIMREQYRLSYAVLDVLCCDLNKFTRNISAHFEVKQCLGSIDKLSIFHGMKKLAWNLFSHVQRT